VDGVYPVTLEVHDGDGGTTQQSWTISVSGTGITLDGAGNLVIDDIAAPPKHDNLTIKSDTVAGLFEISDPSAVLSSDIPGVSGNYTNRLYVPFATVTGPAILVNTRGGDDLLTLDFGLGDFAKTIRYDGDGGLGDALRLQNGSFDTSIYTFQNPTDGSIMLDPDGPAGSSLPVLVEYFGLDPIISTITSTNVTLTYTGGSESINVTAAGIGQTQVTSSAGETTTFINPTNSLTINATNGTDMVAVNSLASNYAALTITGDDPTDVVNVNSPIALATGFDLTIDAGIINLANPSADVSTQGTGSVSLKAHRNIALNAGSSIISVNGGITLEANLAGSTLGNFAGISVTTANISASGTGSILLKGRGGNGGLNHGVSLTAGSLINGGTTGTGLSIDGTGGSGTNPNNFGVLVSDLNTRITSNGGNVIVTGTGGGSGAASANRGVEVRLSG
jgi:hypothetical protein